MTKLRSTFAEYGLGASTGLIFHLNPLVLPDEYSTANFITNAFGQFDNYTPMQMAQYVSTVANKGTRISPIWLKGFMVIRTKVGLET